MTSSSDAGTDKFLLRSSADVLQRWAVMAETLGVSRNTAMTAALAGVLAGLEMCEKSKGFDIEEFGEEVAEGMILGGGGHWLLRAWLLHEYQQRLEALESPIRKWDDERERDQLVALVRDRMAKLKEGAKSYGK